MRTGLHNLRRSLGITMIEVLITIVISAIGLLAIASIQARMHVAEVESYQRAQATILLRYITDRINANRKNAMSYVTADAVGSNVGLRDCSGLNGANLDVCEWNNMLAGASEAQGAQANGAMIGALGCVLNTQPMMPRAFTIAVVWQGLSPTTAPASTGCGNGAYADDRTRRAVIAPITIGCLQNDPNTGLCVTP